MISVVSLFLPNSDISVTFIVCLPYFSGILTIIIGFLICVMEQCAPVSVSNFFLLETSYIPTEDKQDKHIMQHMAKHDDLDVELKMRRYIQEQVQFAKPKVSCLH